MAAGTVKSVPDLSAPNDGHEVVCPHCKKSFRAELMAGETERHRGFKCPHCKLFVPADRAAK
jgi:DNA-directed RNA polymerase subunit RPC12/RpoP